MRRVVLMVDNATAEELDQIAEKIADKHPAWWHWFQSVWLIKDSLDRPCEYWMNLAKKHIADGSVLAITVQPGEWSAWMNPDANEWMKSVWDYQDPDC